MASTNIRRLLTEKTFAFTLVGLTSIHRRIFDGVFKFAGQIRDYNITKKEEVLRGDTVFYVSAPDIRKAVEYALKQKRQFDYSKVDRNGLVKHIIQIVNPPEELRAEQVQQIDRTSTEQPTEQVTEQVRALLLTLSNEQLSLKGLMEKIGLKHRPTFVENYIIPTLEAGILKVLYPNKPNHPRQKYLLTTKGLALYNEIKSK